MIHKHLILELFHPFSGEDIVILPPREITWKSKEHLLRTTILII